MVLVFLQDKKRKGEEFRRPPPSVPIPLTASEYQFSELFDPSNNLALHKGGGETKIKKGTVRKRQKRETIIACLLILRAVHANPVNKYNDTE